MTAPTIAQKSRAIGSINRDNEPERSGGEWVALGSVEAVRAAIARGERVECRNVSWLLEWSDLIVDPSDLSSGWEFRAMPTTSPTPPPAAHAGASAPAKKPQAEPTREEIYEVLRSVEFRQDDLAILSDQADAIHAKYFAPSGSLSTRDKAAGSRGRDGEGS